MTGAPPKDGGRCASTEGAAATPAGSVAFGPRFTALVRARWPQILALLTALFAIDMVRNYAFRPWTLKAMFDEQIVLVVLTVAFGIGGGSVTGTLVAEALPLRGIPRALATVAFALTGAALAMGAMALWWPTGLMPETVGEGMSTSAFVLRNLWYYSATSLLLAAYFVTRDRDAAIERAAQLAELERAGVRRAVLESRLKVIQARVEPELLFEVLADVQRLYGSSPRDAEALLDDLIVYLRAALPQMRGDASTLGREVELACALVKVTAGGRDRSLACVNRIAPGLADLPFPPMVLLPLAHAAADTRAARVVFGASVLDERNEAGATVQVSIAVASSVQVAGWQSERLDPLREILRTYFGEGATLDAGPAPEGCAATLTFTLPRSLVSSAPATMPNAAVARSAGMRHGAVGAP